MSTPNLIPQPPIVQPTPPQSGKINLQKALASQDFNNLNLSTQRDMLAKGLNPDLANFDDHEFIAFKKQAAAKYGIKDTNPSTPRADSIIEFARPFVSDVVGVGAGALAGPETLGSASVPTGLAVKGAVDALLQHLESRPPTSITSNALNLEPGGVASTIVNSGEMIGTNALLGKIMGMLGKGAKATTEANVDYLGQPSTASQIPQTVKDLSSNLIKNVNKEGLLSKSTMTYGMTLPISLLQGHVSPYQGAAALYTGIKLTKAATKTLMDNPRTSRIIKAMIDKEPLGVSNEMAGKAITDALQGSVMALTGPGGDEPMTMKDGKLVPISQ